ncbi:retrovirus-related pol polyprotein from transposon TNT 1-94, partial [Tanacetum coccineum]
NMPNLEEIVYSKDDERVGAKADMNNLDTFMSFSATEDQPQRFSKLYVWMLLITSRAQKGNPSIKRSKLDRSYARRSSSIQVTIEEGIDYDEVFALVARIEAIRLFLACASFKDFVVYQMDVKSAFLYGKIEEEVYVYQPSGFEDPEFPDRVYKVDDIIFGSTKKILCTEFEKLMHKKFQMSSMASTPMETSKPLMKDENAEDVNVHLYRSMIGSL